MKKLSDKDIAQMISGADFCPDDSAVRRTVRAKLKLGQLIPVVDESVYDYVRLDLHGMTEEQAWSAIMELAKSGVRTAYIITGASGILRQKFPQWATESLLAPYILSFSPINNGSFSVKFRKRKSD